MNQDDLTTATGALRAVGIKITIIQKGNSLYLRCVLPPRPGAHKVKWHRQDAKPLPRGLQADRKGLKLAKQRAISMWGQLQGGQFDWATWEQQGEIASPQTVGEWVEGFKVYWLGKGDCSPETWDRHWHPVFNRLHQDVPLTYGVLVAGLVATAQGSRNRRRSASCLQRLADFAEIEGDLVALGKGYRTGRSEQGRELPTDEQIMEWRLAIGSDQWRWVYGAIATFGLRPHEAFFMEKTENPLIWEVTAGKTGPRRVSAVFPEWVERWELMAGHPPTVGAYLKRDRSHDFVKYGDRVTKCFQRYQIPFTAYSLRHSYAVRPMGFPGISDSTAAKLMGHSLTVHNRTYQKWLTARDVGALYTSGIATGIQAPNEPLGEG